MVVRGQALEAEGRDRQAADSYYDALMINRTLLKQVLDAAEGTQPPPGGAQP